MSKLSRLLALTVVFAVAMTSGVALANHTSTSSGVVSGFEIDGNYNLDGLPGATRDWSNVASTPDASAVTAIYDPPDAKASGSEFIFSNGSKEQEPGNWAFSDQKPPSKADITRAYIATEFSATKSSIWLASERIDSSGSGDFHANFELSKSSATRTVNGHVVPVRTPGTAQNPQDLLIVYDFSGGTGPVNIEVRTWTGTPLNGSWELISPPPSAARGDINGTTSNRPAAAPFFGGSVAARRFGEAALDLKQIFGQGFSLCDQGGFHQFSVKSRSSGESFNSALKDYVGPAGIITCPQPHSTLDKGVRVHKAQNPQDSYTDSVNANPGATLDYQVLYKNTGAANATNIDVQDAIQPRQTYVLGSCAGGNSCSFNGTTKTVSWHINGPVAPNASVSLTFSAQLDSAFPKGTTTVDNQATGTASGESGFASDTTTVTVVSAPAPSTVKSVRNVTTNGNFAGSAAASPGDRLEYRIVYTNNGTSAATGVSIEDSIATGQTYVASSCTGGASCSFAAGKVTWNIGTVAANGGTATVTFKVDLDASFPAGTTQVKNTAVSKSPDHSDNSSNETTVTVTAAPAPATVKSVRDVTTGGSFAGSAVALPGDRLEYRIVYTNNGKAPATAVTVEDSIAAGQTYVASSCSGGTSCSFAAGKVTWNVGTVAANGGTVTLLFRVDLASSFPAGVTTIKNTAVSKSPNHPDNTSNETTVTVTSAPAPSTAKSVRNVTTSGSFGSTATAQPGDRLEYRIVYTNNGNAPATAVTVEDSIAARQTYVASSCSGGTSCSFAAGKVTWNVGTVAANGGTVTLLFRVDLAPTFPAGTTTIKNTAVSKSPDHPDNTSPETTVTVTGPPALGLLKSANTESVAVDDSITYTLAYFNTSKFDASNVTVTEDIPEGTEFSSCTGGCSGDPDGPITWTIPSVPGNTTAESPAGSVTLTVTVTNIEGCQICNVATISSPDENEGTPVNSNQVCVATLGGASDQSSEAFGIYADVPLLSPGTPFLEKQPTTEDGDDQNDTLLDVPADPVAHVKLLSVSKGGSIDGTDANASAVATTAEVKAIDTDFTDLESWLVTATGIQVVSSSHADGETAGSSSAGSVLFGVTVAGQNLGTVTEPKTVVVNTPLGTATIQLLEMIGSGAAGEVLQPQARTFASGLEVNGIHLTITDPLGNILRDVIVAHAKSKAAFPSALGCGIDAAHVSGRAYSLQVNADETILDPDNQLAFGEVGTVTLPSTGGKVTSTLAHIGPLSVDGGANTLAESNTAFNSTEGTVDNGANTASSSSSSQIKKLRLLDTDSADDNENFLITADLIRATSESSFDGTTASSTGGTTIANLVIAGTEVCSALGLDDVGGNNVCTPAADTVLLGIPNAVVVLNETFTGSGQDASSLTVNAIHIYILGLGNPFGLPAGADITIASAHSDVAGAGSLGISRLSRGEGPTIVNIPLAPQPPEQQAAGAPRVLAPAPERQESKAAAREKLEGLLGS